MRKIKISLAALAFLLTVGVTYANNQESQQEQCASQPNGPADMPLPSPDCDLGSVFCCYEPGTPNLIQRPPNP